MNLLTRMANSLKGLMRGGINHFASIPRYC